MKKFTLLLATVLILFGCKNNPEKPSENTSNPQEKSKELSTAEAIAYKNGFEKWNAVEEINFTFNVDRPNSHSERSWSWKPKTNDVTMMTANDTISYNRAKIDSTNMKVDAAFINDKYWLLAPFNLVWDKGTSFIEKENQISLISKDTLNLLTITYGNEGGYTPGDAYDFYFDDKFIIKEWVFRKGNDSIPTMTTTWEDYETYKGLTIAKVHQDSTKNFKLHFTNISVK